jgi:hypothetical protein
MVSPFLRPLLSVGAALFLAQGAQAATVPVPSSAASSTAVAAPAATTGQSGQRNRMKACNAQAREKDLHKAERRAFMKQCLSKGPAA